MTNVNNINKMLSRLADEDPCKHLKFETVNRESRILGFAYEQVDIESDADYVARRSDTIDWIDEQMREVPDYYVGSCYADAHYVHVDASVRFCERIILERNVFSRTHINEYWRHKHRARLMHLWLTEQDADYAMLQAMEDYEIRAYSATIVAESKNKKELSQRMGAWMRTLTKLPDMAFGRANRVTYNDTIFYDHTAAKNTTRKSG